MAMPVAISSSEDRAQQQGQLEALHLVGRRREHRRQRVAERRLDDVEQQPERADQHDRPMQPRHRQGVEARGNAGIAIVGVPDVRVVAQIPPIRTATHTAASGRNSAPPVAPWGYPAFRRPASFPAPARLAGTGSVRPRSRRSGRIDKASSRGLIWRPWHAQP